MITLHEASAVELCETTPPPPPPPLPSPPPGGDLEGSAEYPHPSIPPPIPFSGIPAPPPPPPVPSASPPSSAPSPPQNRPPPVHEAAHAAAMAAIVNGGVSLRKVTHVAERPVGEEKVVDVVSEMRQKLRKKKKEEVSISRRMESMHLSQYTLFLISLLCASLSCVACV